MKKENVRFQSRLQVRFFLLPIQIITIRYFLKIILSHFKNATQVFGAGTMRCFSFAMGNMMVICPIAVLFHIVRGLRYVHSRGLAHRRIHPKKIMISPIFPVVIKLSDLCKSVSASGSYSVVLLDRCESSTAKKYYYYYVEV